MDYLLLDSQHGLLGVVPIVMNTGAAILPAILAAAVSIVTVLFRPSQWGRLMREKPRLVIGLLLFVTIGATVWYARPSPAQASGRSTTLSASGRDAVKFQTDWTAVALAYLRDKSGRPVEIPPHTETNPPPANGATITRLNPQRTGYAGGPSPTGLQFAWSYIDPDDEFAMFLASPVIHGRWLYAATTTLTPPSSVGAVVCLDAKSGERRWVTFLEPADGNGELEPLRGIFSSPAVTADGRNVLIGQGLHPDSDMSLLCLDAATGRIAWQVQTPLHIESSPAIGGDIVVVGCGAIETGPDKKPAPGANPGYVLGVRISTGEELWRVPLNDPESSPVIVAGVAYIGSSLNGNAVAAIRIADDDALRNAGQQRLLWKTDTPYPAVNPVSFADGVLYVGCGNGNFAVVPDNPAGAVLAIDAGSGEILWQVEVADSVLGAVAVADGKAIVPVRNGEVIALDVANRGEVIWRARINGSMPVMAGAALTSSHVYAVSSNGYLGVIDANTGDLLERIYLNRSGRPGELGLTVSAPIVAGGTVYVGSETGGLHALTGAIE